MPREILYDRTKTVVRSHVGRLRGLDEERLHPEALASACHYGFRIRLCAAYRPQTKGKVEADVRWTRGRLTRGHGWGSYAEANAAWALWNEEVARRRLHGTHGEMVAKRALRDRAALLPLPPRPYLVCARTTRAVGRDGYASFEGRRYPVPGARPGERVEVTVGASEIELRRIGECRLLARHERGAVHLVLPDPAVQPLGVRLPNIQSQTELDVTLAALAISTIIPVVLFLLFQRVFLRGAGLGGAVKG